jgi:hypothetical protein
LAAQPLLLSVVRGGPSALIDACGCDDDACREELGCSPAQAGVFFAWQEVASFVTDWSVALLETGATARGVPLLRIRKLATLLGAVGNAVCVVCLGRCRRALPAAVCCWGAAACYIAHHSGFGANLLEVGGTQTANVNAVNNMIKSSAGILSPALGLLLRKRTGSWRPLFHVCAALHVASALVFGAFAQIEPAKRFRDTPATNG